MLESQAFIDQSFSLEILFYLGNFWMNKMKGWFVKIVKDNFSKRQESSESGRTKMLSTILFNEITQSSQLI